MGLLLETMSAFTTILKGSARPTNYQTLSTSDDDRAIGLATDDDQRQREGEKHDPAVYLSFWLFGAGTLLGWSGTFTPVHFRSALTTTTTSAVLDAMRKSRELTRIQHSCARSLYWSLSTRPNRRLGRIYLVCYRQCTVSASSYF